ncbi:hypothetical protein BDB01DRAFT_337455 [Pilobolus umbonatus]|nr:hypothetical protein BDB01DRAFT_337455 [Pilobolus umbonatus]
MNPADLHTETDRKRKAEDDGAMKEFIKRPLLESVKAESEQAAINTTEESDDEGEDSDDNSSTLIKLESFPIKEEPVLETIVPFDRLIVLHLEATCDENPTNPAAVQVTKENSEIIELTFVVLKSSNMEILHKQQIYVKPERTPLTSFCTEVTGIKWSKLEGQGTLKDAIAELDRYIQKNIEDQKLSFCFVTHGGWVLRIQLPREARDKNIELPPYLSFCRMFDLKQEIQRWQVHHPEVSLRSTSLRDLCEIFHKKRVVDQTVGLNAALTTINIMRYLTGFRHPDVFVHPIDTNADLKQFKKEESQVIHLAGLPFEVTQGELEAWFSSNGLRPTTMWMIQPTDNSKPSISGFVIFQQHDDAMRALSLNGRCLGDRPIEVCPSSSRVVDAAGNMLVPFPLQAKSRQLRPGDWNCVNCGFHNFASRRHCFKCNADNPAPSTSHHPVGPHTSTFNIGDWMCPNNSCNFHNYASRTQCKKCGTFKSSSSRFNSSSQGNSSSNNNSSSSNVNGGSTSNHNSNSSSSGISHSSSMPSSSISNSHAPSGGGYSSSTGYSGSRPHHHITFRAGDWYCPNPVCNFQNFASRNSCFRCHTPAPNHPPSSQPQHAQYSPHQPGYGYSPEPNSNYSSGSGSGGYGGSGGGSGGYGYSQSSGGYSHSNYPASGGGYGGSGGGGGGYSYGGGGGGGYSYGGGHQSGSPGGGHPNTQFRPGDWYW